MEKVEEALCLSESDAYNLKDDNPKKDKETEEEYEKRIDAIWEEREDRADYKGMMKEYAEEYAKRFSEDNEIELKYESLDSPREYNFATDRIFADIEEAEVKRLVKMVDREKLREKIKEDFTSCDGFSSHYSSYIDDWNLDDTEELDHNQVGTIIECMIQNKIDESGGLSKYIYDLMEDFYR